MGYRLKDQDTYRIHMRDTSKQAVHSFLTFGWLVVTGVLGDACLGTCVFRLTSLLACLRDTLGYVSDNKPTQSDNKPTVTHHTPTS